MGHAIVVDLGFGDAGKGTVVDHLCRTSPVTAVVRFNGGAQAAHNVVTDDGRHHTFAQFGSGTFRPGVRTHLSRFMLVDPLALAAEADHLRRLGVGDALDRLTVDRDALLTTPYHRAANRARERARGAARHGSCGMGIGETASYALGQDDAPRAGDCLSPARLHRRLTALHDWYRTMFPDGEDVPDVTACADAFTAFAGRVRIVGGGHLHGLLRSGDVVFEGAQGVLLDEWHGFHPYTTWSTTTFANAETLLDEAGAAAARLGVLRTYATRHGPGPFVTEDAALTAALPEPHNGTGPWQGAFRAGHLDAVALRYALEVTGGVDGLAVTHLDVAGARPDLRVCHAYETSDGRLDRLPPGGGDLARQAALTRRLASARPVYAPLGPRPAETIEGALGTPVVLTSHGPAASAKRTAAPLRPRTSRPLAGWPTSDAH
ncbi:adenylosuccinate synthetase [Actinomadura violacea]|uniref:Adenylosuccinate synthetase n=1 Tax=Actinomadura violacea TaxID=2819934 RepID=A0ABS3RS75_9ACTN|nr:adenylosuccinate synthetase [Actinomadura violacea]MBO2459582.1 adenylosuccinate synthetase [Actinomadura violacea]